MNRTYTASYALALILSGLIILCSVTAHRVYAVSIAIIRALWIHRREVALGVALLLLALSFTPWLICLAWLVAS